MRESEKKEQRSLRQKQQTDLLEEALSRPGIREAMRVFQGWEQVDRNINSYRTVANDKGTVSSSDHANVAYSGNH